MLKIRLESEDWEVSIAENGEEALGLMAKHSFDLVLLDLLMPRKDGFEVLKEMKINSKLINIPVIVLSNLGGDEDIKKALSLGADDYFVKTQHPMNEIVDKIKNYFAEGKHPEMKIPPIVSESFVPVQEKKKQEEIIRAEKKKAKTALVIQKAKQAAAYAKATASQRERIRAEKAQTESIVSLKKEQMKAVIADEKAKARALIAEEKKKQKILEK